MIIKVLVVDDELAIREMLGFILEQHGFIVIYAKDYEEALQFTTDPLPDLILLDWMLPGGSGIKLAKDFKQHAFTKEIPIIMLTAKSEEEDKIKGLNIADDYMTKPFSPKELIARINAVLRRSAPNLLDQQVEIMGLKLDPVSHHVTGHDIDLSLGPTEFKLLHFFMTHSNRVYSREQLLNNVWGTNVYIEDRTVDVHIRRLRKILSQSGHDGLIQTVRGSGYRFSDK